MSSHVHHIHGQQLTHRLGRRRSSTKLSIKNGTKQAEETVVPFTSSAQPNRIWPMPEPHVVVICYSLADKASYVEIETEIIPELNQRFPHVPRVLVATKEDLKGKLSTVKSVGSGLADKCVGHESSYRPECTPTQKMDRLSPLPNTINSLTTNMGKILRNIS